MASLLRNLFLNTYLFIIASNVATILGITATSYFWMFNLGILATYNILNQFIKMDAIFSPISMLRLPMYFATAYLISFIAPTLGLSAVASNLLYILAPYVYETFRATASFTLFSIRNLFQREVVANNPENEIHMAFLLGNNLRAQQAILNINNPQSLLNIGLTALQRGNNEVFTAVVNRLEVLNPAHVILNDNLLLRAAVHHQREEAVTLLLRKRTVRMAANANNNEALREVCINGNVRIARALLELPSVDNNLTFNNNEAVRLAERHDRLTIIDLLLNKPAVANFVYPPRVEPTFTARNIAQYYPAGAAVPPEHRPADQVPPPRVEEHPFRPAGINPLLDMLFNIPDRNGPAYRRQDRDLHVEEAEDNDLRRLARDEGAMAANNERQRTALNEMEQRYRVEFQRKGRPQIFKEIREYLIAQYNRNPAMYMGQRLPLNRGLLHFMADETPYYRHATHTAYRYLFLSPNPWISPLANFTRRVEGGWAADTSEEDLNKIAYMWLAATDVNGAMPEGYDREGLLNEFVQAIAELGRAHNYDNTRRNARGELEHYDDMQGDKPTCGFGVNQRITQFYMVFLNDRPETRPLTADIIVQKFRQEMINESPLAGTLYNKISRLNLDQLNALEKAMNDDIVLLEGTDEQRQLMDTFNPTAAEIAQFVENCKTYFGQNRITRRNDTRIAHGAGRFDTYQALIEHLARERVVGVYFDDTMRIINHFKEQIQARNGGEAAPAANRARTEQFNNRRRRAHTEDDAGANPAPRRRRAVAAH